MRVLLVGKFPPCQGGIAAKTYWLYRALAPRGIRFDVVTMVPHVYRSDSTGELPEAIRVRQLTPGDGPPWFIPGGNLWTERLVTAALELTDKEDPDLIEANYLAPYGMAAFVASRLLGAPLLLRHAGSDLAKLLPWPEAQRGLEELLASAGFVATTPGASQLPERAGAAATLIEIPRYVPDPGIFPSAGSPPSEHRLLVAAKLNFHWRLKALDTLAAALELRPGWRLDAVADGKGRESFETELRKRRLADRVRREAFVAPDAIPALLAGITAVWAVERAGGISDFSNLVWEALARGRPCLVARSTAEHPDAELLRRSNALLTVDPEDPVSIAAALDQAASMPAAEPPPPGLQQAFEAYVEANAALYFKAAKAKGRES